MHGEAVSAGMVMAAWMSARLGWCDASLHERTLALLRKVGTPVNPPKSMTAEDFSNIMAVDKKARGGVGSGSEVRGMGGAWGAAVALS